MIQFPKISNLQIGILINSTFARKRMHEWVLHSCICSLVGEENFLPQSRRMMLPPLSCRQLRKNPTLCYSNESNILFRFLLGGGLFFCFFHHRRNSSSKSSSRIWISWFAFIIAKEARAANLKKAQPSSPAPAGFFKIRRCFRVQMKGKWINHLFRLPLLRVERTVWSPRKECAL